MSLSAYAFSVAVSDIIRLHFHPIYFNCYFSCAAYTSSGNVGLLGLENPTERCPEKYDRFPKCSESTQLEIQRRLNCI